jgi:hypothetical protein
VRTRLERLINTQNGALRALSAYRSFAELILMIKRELPRKFAGKKYAKLLQLINGPNIYKDSKR